MKREKYDRAIAIDEQFNSLKRNIECLQKEMENNPFKHMGCILVHGFNSNDNFFLTEEMISLIIQEYEKKIEILEKEFELL